MKALVAALVLVGGEARASAGSCGDGGGDGGSSDSGSSSSSSSDSSGGGSSTPSCVEESDVLGRRQCSGFGSWALPGLAPILTVESVVSVRRVALDGYAFRGEIDHGAEGSYRYRLVADELGADARLVSGDLRILGGRTIYGGVELGVGGVAADEDAMVATTTGDLQTATMTPTVQMSFGYGAVVGARLPLHGLRLSAEVFAGGRTLQVGVESALGACESTAVSYASRVVIEPRARVEAWISPWFTVGAYAGSDLRGAAPAFGAFLAGHTRAFDGGR